MILTGNKIQEEVKNNKIFIEPFCEKSITTNSYDLTLSNKFIVYHDEVLDPKKRPIISEITIPEGGYYELQKGDFILGCSNEALGSNFYVPLIHAKSGVARLGLFVHVTADLIDIGSIGKTTFQLYATLPCRIYPGMKIAQVTFWQPKGEINLYNGKYQGSQGPRISEIWKDF